jgi:NADPH2 dehydrogenase
MSTLFSDYTLKKFTIKNRVVFPPVVCHGFASPNGFVSEKNVQHYRLRAEGGAGIIITEATCVRPDGKASPNQLGIWSDYYIEGLNKISSVVKSSGALSLIQLHHAGLVTPVPVNDRVVGPSADPNNPKSRSLSVKEIGEIRDCFIAAAIRAKKAGFDGIELHGAHGYLLNQFANSAINVREDDYGKDITGRLKLAYEIIRGTRSQCGENFIIGYRMGANTPTLQDGIEIAIYLESSGIDLLHVSHGGNLLNLPRTPKGFEFNWIAFSGISVKEHVTLPVIVVNEIKTKERVSYLIENGKADFVSIGRPMLADPFWVRNVKENEPVNICSGCKPKCRWYESYKLCPAFQRLSETVPDLA